MNGHKLRREVGIFGAVVMGLGAILGTGIFVSIGQAIQVAGSGIIVAVLLACFVAVLNGLSSAQLAAAHPVSGGTYEYGYRWLHPSLGFTAGWMFVCAKSASAATAALGLTGYLFHLSEWNDKTWQTGVSLSVVALITFTVFLGIRWSSLLNLIVVSITVFSLIFFVICGITLANEQDSPPTMTTMASVEGIKSVAMIEQLSGLLSASALMFVAYTGYGRIATLGEEIIEPRKNIPIAIIMTLLLAFILYASVAWTLLATIGPSNLATRFGHGKVPLAEVAKTFNFPYAPIIVSVGAITAMLGVLINLILGLSRVVLAMGRRGDLPAYFANVDTKRSTPGPAVLAVGTLISLLVLIGDVKLTWSFSAFTVLIYYAITNLAATRLDRSEQRFPRAFTWLGLCSCLLLAFWVDLRVWSLGLAIIVLGLAWQSLFSRIAKVE